LSTGQHSHASTQTGIVTIAQIETIAVIFTAPEEQLQESRPRRRAAAEGDRADHRRQHVLSTGTLSLTTPGRRFQRDDPPQGAFGKNKIILVAGQSSPLAC